MSTCEPHGNLLWPAGEPFPDGNTPYCRACWRAAGGSVSIPRHSLPVAPCSLLGEPLTGTEREARGLDHRRAWHWCGHPAKPLGDAVCGCAGCGPSCPGYAG